MITSNDSIYTNMKDLRPGDVFTWGENKGDVFIILETNRYANLRTGFIGDRSDFLVRHWPAARILLNP